MRQLFLLICVYLLLSGQVIAAASSSGAGGIYEGDTPPKTSGAAAPATKGFLDAYDPEKITPDTFIPNVATFGYIIFLGESVHGIKTDKKSNLEAWQAKLRKVTKSIQESVFTHEPARGDEPVPPNPIPWLSHTLEGKDYDIAEALFLVAEEWKGKCPTYTEAELATWEKLHSILEVHPIHKAKDPKEDVLIVNPLKLAAMDLWVFLMATTHYAFPYNPSLPRFSAPSESAGIKSSDEVSFLTRAFKGLVITYRIAKSKKQ